MAQQLVEVPFAYVTNYLPSNRHKIRESVLTRGSVAGYLTVLEDAEFPVVMRVVDANSRRLDDAEMADVLHSGDFDIRRSADGKLWRQVDGDAGQDIAQAIGGEPGDRDTSPLSAVKWGGIRPYGFANGGRLTNPAEIVGVRPVNNRAEREAEVLSELGATIACAGKLWTPTKEPVLVASPHHVCGSVSVQMDVFGDHARSTFGLNEMDAAIDAATTNGNRESTYVRGAMDVVRLPGR